MEKQQIQNPLSELDERYIKLRQEQLDLDLKANCVLRAYYAKSLTKEMVQDLRENLKNIETSREKSSDLRKTLNELCKKSIDLLIIEERMKVGIKIQNLSNEICQIEERLRFLEPLIPMVNRVLDKVNKE